MRGDNYREGLTFRTPRLSVLRAEYAASLRDQGLSYTAIAWALGLHGKRRRAFQIVQHGRRLRDEAIVAKIKGTVLGATLDANVAMYRYLHLAIEREYQAARKAAGAELAADAGDYLLKMEYSTEPGAPSTPYVAPNYKPPTEETNQ